MGPRTPWLGLLVATLLVGLGLTEGAGAVRGAEVTGPSAASAAVLPLGVLIGGGLLVLAGTILEGVLPWPALVLTALGCGASIPAALWTVFVPLLLVTFFVVRAWQLPVVEAAAATRTSIRPERVIAAQARGGTRAEGSGAIAPATPGSDR